MSTHRLAALRTGRALRAGFTLIELLAVMLILGILVAALTPMINDAIQASKVTACGANLGEIFKAQKIYEMKYKRLPSESGVRFFADLYKMKAMENTKTNAQRLTCPAVDLGALEIGRLPWEEWWTDMDLVTGGYSAYAGRDMREHPIKRLTGKEPLVADDNDGGIMNHPTTTNVLYGDGSVQTFEIELLRKEGLVMDEEEVLLVGPDSPVEDLQKLSLD